MKLVPMFKQLPLRCVALSNYKTVVNNYFSKALNIT